MNKLTTEQINKAKPNPVFKGLPDELKDPKNFKKIEKKLANVMVSDHKHRLISAFHKCKRCQDKFKKKREAILALGFNSINQYQHWQKVMRILIDKPKLVLYERD